MAKISIPFEMNYPVKVPGIKNLRMVTDHAGDLTIKGTAYLNPDISALSPGKRIHVDIDFIEWNGVDIMPVLDSFHDTELIQEYAEKKAILLFTLENERRTA